MIASLTDDKVIAINSFAFPWKCSGVVYVLIGSRLVLAPVGMTSFGFGVAMTSGSVGRV